MRTAPRFGEKCRLASKVVAGLAILLACDCSDNRPIQISVDFSAAEETRSMSGFLGTLASDKIKSQRLTPLKPRLWRGGQVSEDTLARAESLGIRYVLMLSDGWGYPHSFGGGDTRAPFVDFAAWEKYVAEVARRYGTRVLYDIWNEPDIPIFWGFWSGADFDAFLETYRRAHDVIRSILGKQAVILGPGLSFFATSRLDRFVEYCRANRLTVQILSHHLLYQPDCRLPDVERDLLEIRKKYLENPEYASIGFTEMQVNEFCMAYLQNTRPGSIIAFMRHLERARVDGASKACWAHPDECSNPVDCLDWKKWKTCSDGSINGLLTPGHRPRAIWWAYKHYVDGAGSRVGAESSHPELVPVASRSSTHGDQAQVLIASYGDGLESPLGPITLALDHLESLSFGRPETSRVKAALLRIPYRGRGSEEVANPAVIKRDVWLPVSEGRTQIQIESISPYEVLVLLVSSEDSEVATQ